MTESEIVVEKVTTYLPMSAEALADAAEFQAAWGSWSKLTHEEKLKRMAQVNASAVMARAQQRADATPRIPLTLSTLLAKLDWTPQYAEHVVQSYCECGETSEGWEYCEHAKDEGVAP